MDGDPWVDRPVLAPKAASVCLTLKSLSWVDLRAPANRFPGFQMRTWGLKDSEALCLGSQMQQMADRTLHRAQQASWPGSCPALPCLALQCDPRQVMSLSVGLWHCSREPFPCLPFSVTLCPWAMLLAESLLGKPGEGTQGTAPLPLHSTHL